MNKLTLDQYEKASKAWGDEPRPTTEDLKPETDNDVLKRYEINIQFYDSGVVIRVGCKNFAFSDKAEALKQIKSYFLNPKQTVLYWTKITL